MLACILRHLIWQATLCLLQKSIIPWSHAAALSVPANDTAFSLTDSGSDNLNKRLRKKSGKGCLKHSVKTPTHQF